MKRICAVMIGLALLVVTPGLATADSTHQQAINLVIQRALSQRGVPYAYGGGNIAGPSLGTAAVDTPVGCCRRQCPRRSTARCRRRHRPQPQPCCRPRRGTPGDSRVGFDSSGLVLYAFAGVGIKMPRSSGEQYKVGQKVLPSQALPGDLIFYGPEGSQSVALFIGNGQMVEATDPAVTVSPVRTTGMTPYLTRIIA